MYTPFLRQVAQYFHEKGNLEDYCFVMPNHRSCKFFERELDLTASGVFLTPDMMPINEFVARLSGDVLVNTIDALFILYKCYTSLAGNEDYPFDKFVYWGNVLLNDFNDVDMYLVDPEQIFTNVREHREIQSTYLDPDLQEIVSHFFNLSVEGSASQDEDFWINYSAADPDKEEVRASYLKLWQSMLELYKKYNSELKNRGLTSMGAMYRDAATAVKDNRDMGHKCYVFVGFNALSTSEIAIFKRLENRGKALFFWDTESPVFGKNFPSNNGSQFVEFFKQQFPEPNDFVPEKITEFPEVEVWGVPSNVGQAKCAFNLIETLVDEKKITDPLNAIDTAIVLPDEALFVPLLNSLSPRVPNINVTMGYPLSNSDVASLMRVVAKLHRQARRDGGGQWCYYRSDVKVLLSHPIIKSCYGEQALALIQNLDADNVFLMPESMVRGLPFEMLFKTVDDNNDPQSVTNFLRELMKFCEKVRTDLLSTSDNHDEESDEDNNDSVARGTMTLQEAFLNQYIEVLNRLIQAISHYNVPPCENTVFFLLDRLASVFSIPFEGEPLLGLQVMGMLETRCLDFKNIIIMSANERVLPRKFRSSSFITDFMRRAYGMSTVQDQDSMWTYYFYRLISRASHVYMLYDTSMQSMGTGEPTRFVNQLKMVYGCDIKEVDLTMPVPVSEEVTINVPKTGHVEQVLKSYLSPGGSKRLSASSINDYINCPLLFYFRHIERLNADNTDVDFMDSSTFGTIVHNTLQLLYYPDVDGAPRTGEYKVTGAMITDFMNKSHLNHVVCQMVNSEYGHKTKLNEPLTGEASIVSEAIMLFVESALNYDLGLLAGDNDFFTVLECERKHSDVVLNFGYEDFNFTYTADRIDRLSNGTLRMVDYKTGHDETDFETMDDLFLREDHRRKAILQLMLYCNAYALETGYTGPIKPVIYTLSDMSKANITQKVDKKKVVLNDYLSVNDLFKTRMGELMHEFFNVKAPFSQTRNTRPQTSPCRFCKFVDFCRR